MGTLGYVTGLRSYSIQCLGAAHDLGQIAQIGQGGGVHLLAVGGAAITQHQGGDFR